MVHVTPENKPFIDLVQVRATGAFGTGLLVGPGVVLTALHCVCDPNANWQVRDDLGVYLWRELQQGTEKHYCARIVWPRTEALKTRPPDVAVLKLEGPEPPGALAKPEFGVLPLAPTPGSARGFPKAAEGPQLPGGRIEHDQPGRVHFTSLTRRALTIDAVGQHELKGQERWAGLSGGPLLVDSRIVGVMREVPNGWNGEAIEAEPLLPLLRDDPDLSELLGAKSSLRDPITMDSEWCGQWLYTVFNNSRKESVGEYFWLIGGFTVEVENSTLIARGCIWDGTKGEPHKRGLLGTWVSSHFGITTGLLVMEYRSTPTLLGRKIYSNFGSQISGKWFLRLGQNKVFDGHGFHITADANFISSDPPLIRAWKVSDTLSKDVLLLAQQNWMQIY